MLHFRALDESDAGNDTYDRQDKSPNSDQPRQRRIKPAAEWAGNCDVYRKREQDAETDEGDAAKFVPAPSDDGPQMRGALWPLIGRFIRVNGGMATHDFGSPTLGGAHSRRAPSGLICHGSTVPMGP